MAGKQMVKAAVRSTSKSPAGKAREATPRRQALKIALIDAAEQAIAARGLAGLNARELARQAGCALGAIYNVFPDLDAIAYEVNARTLAEFEAFVAARVPAGNDGDPAAELVSLAVAYLDFAVAHQPRWRALFEHRISTPGARLPEWYLAEQSRMFALVERPLAALRPELADDERALLARTMFSAVHGIVSLGLDEKLMSLPADQLAGQVRGFVAALARGLVADATPA
jgi:AcrR family transcriptional regulator